MRKKDDLGLIVPLLVCGKCLPQDILLVLHQPDPPLQLWILPRLRDDEVLLDPTHHIGDNHLRDGFLYRIGELLLDLLENVFGGHKTTLGIWVYKKKTGFPNSIARATSLSAPTLSPGSLNTASHTSSHSMSSLY